MLILFALLTCLMIAVTLSDISRYLIPNWMVLALLVLYPVALWLAHPLPDWKMACVIALAAFAIGYLLFIFRIMGGGDIKLLTAAVLYSGKGATVEFMIYVGMLGGLGTLLLLALRVIAPFIYMKLGKSGADIPRVLTDKEPAPYGVAIAIAFLWMLWKNNLPGLIL